MILTNSEASHGRQAAFARRGAKHQGVGHHWRDLHDLRGTAVTRFAIAGCTEAEIATITGHSMPASGVLDTHYLSRDPALGESAIRKLERGTKSPD